MNPAPVVVAAIVAVAGMAMAAIVKLSEKESVRAAAR